MAKNREWQNKLYYGDNLDVLRKHIKDETIDLCYIDPPFNSKRKYFQIYLNQGNEDKAQAQAFIDTWSWNDIAIQEFDEIIENKDNRFSKQTIRLIEGLEKVLGKGDLLAYLLSMTLRITEIQRILKTTGSFYLHCDPTASHYLKLVCDSIFCPKGGDYRNEIIWHYQAGTKSKTHFGKKHDVILSYQKSKDVVFNVVKQKSLAEYKYDRIDEDGRKYHINGQGNIYYYDNGRTCDDVWTWTTEKEFNQLNSMAKERLGYPTQKPKALLDRIIIASSNKGDIVLDAYCGCGTTVEAAQSLNRKWIGIDITYQSISLIIKRLEDGFGKEVSRKIYLDGVPKDFESAIALANKSDDRVRKEFEKWCVLAYSDNRAMINEKKGSDGGIDGTAFMNDYKSETDNEIVIKDVYFSVKSDLKPHVSYIRDFYGVIQRDKVAFGIFITLYEPTKDMLKECNQYGYYKCNIIDKKYPVIKIVSVKDIMNGDRLEIPISHKKDVVKSAELKADYTEKADLFSIAAEPKV